jgi:hypothetical protein
LAATKALAVAGYDVTTFEASDRLGGLWVLGNATGTAAAYRSLTTNTSRRRTEFSDFPMPADWPHYPRHDQILAYLEAYAERFDLRDRIRFGTTVTRAEPREDRGWDVAFADGARRTFDRLCVANGHHWDSRFPDPPIPGTFAGKIVHGRDFIDAAPFAGQRVAVVGMGNSAMDIAVDCSYVADATFLAGRRGVHIIPKTFFGRPSDEIRRHPQLPFWVRRLATRVLTRLCAGDQAQLGLAKPDHAILTAHPTLSDDVFARLGAGAIVPKPAIVAFEGSRARFADGTSEMLDALIYCTGYRFTYPFFAPEFAAALDASIPLFRRVFPIGIDNLMFVGAAQAIGSIFPIAQAQTEWIVAYLRGEYAFPDEPAMRADVVRELERTRARYVAARPNPAQVDADDYVAALCRERRRGAGRARATASPGRDRAERSAAT